MAVKVVVHPDAELEILGAEIWYAERNMLAASAFVLELDQVVRLAYEAPRRWPELRSGARRIVFPRFPFSLIYRVRADEIEIVALAHHKRRPGYWRRR